MADRLLATKRRLSHYYLRRRGRIRRDRTNATAAHPDVNVCGVAIAERYVDGRPTGEMGITLYVERKYPLDEIPDDFVLPTEVNGIRIDVVEVGRLTPLAGTNPAAPFRPAPGGCSVGFASARISSGTLGYHVVIEGRLCMLSNNHVLADENMLPIGSNIFQPSLPDGGHDPGSEIARLFKKVDLSRSNNLVDCAAAEYLNQALADRTILEIGTPSGVARARAGQSVKKFGRTTKQTRGVVHSVDADVTLRYPRGEHHFVHQIAIMGVGGKFSSGGDSGSVVLDEQTNEIVGLLFGGPAQVTFANHIDDVLTALGAVIA